jgi:hypothetical protein
LELPRTGYALSIGPIWQLNRDPCSGYAARVGEVLLFTLSFALGIAVPAVIVRRDVARLAGEQLARSWPEASLWAAIVAFGPLSVPIHFLRTRRSWLGLGLALLWFVAAVLLVAAPVELLAQIFGVAEQ